VQRLAVGEWGRILPPKRMNWDQRDIVTDAYPGLRRLLRPPGGGLGGGGDEARARARVADSGPHPDIIFRGGAFQTSEGGKAFIPPQKNFLGVPQWAEAAQMFEVTQMQLIDSENVLQI
jgi:hypothetical protein